MEWFTRLERRLRPYAVPQLTLYLVAGQAAGVVVSVIRPEWVEYLLLVPAKVAQGELWRLVSFVFAPPLTNPLFAIFGLYLLYLMGSALESTWGTLRYNLYVLIGCLATMAASLLTPAYPTWNTFIDTSVFLAFAFLYPDFELYLLFVFPVKIKWIALLTGIGYGILFVFQPWNEWPAWTLRFALLASIANFLLFFGRSIVSRAWHGQRRMRWQSRGTRRHDQPFHVCAKCGINDRTHPNMDFRYCCECVPARGYCAAHIRDHQHVTRTESAQT